MTYTKAPKPKGVTVVTRTVLRRPPVNKGPTANPRKPLSVTSREIFAQLIAKGQRIEDAYREAGYEGQPPARRALRAAPDIDARIMYLLDRRIEDDAKARHKRHQPTLDRKSRILQELDRIAFSDLRDAIQWTNSPIIDDEGNITGFKPTMTLIPSHLMTADQAAAVKRISSKGGELNVESQDKLAALDKLAKIEGMFVEAGPTTINDNRSLTNVNIGGDNAMEAIKRLAFAIAKAQEHQQLSVVDEPSYALIEGSKE